MAVIVIGRKFTDDQGRELNFPFFSGYDRVKLMYTVNIAFSYTINSANPIEKLSDQLTLLNGNSWEDYGFVEGAEITGNIGGVAIPSSTEITFIDGALMELNNTLTGTDGTYNTGSLKLVQVPDAINFDFNLVENTATGNEFSVIDGEVNRFTCDVSALTLGDNTTPIQLGNKSGGSNFLTDVKRIADSANGNKQYEISITFNPWTIKDPSLYFSNACVKPWARISALAEFNNPSVFISAVNTFTDANTGLIDEVGNGGVPAYTLTSIDIDTINLNAETEFEIRIDGAFDGDSIFNIALYYDAQDEADYKNLSTDFDQNTIMLTSDVGLAVDDTYNLVSATRPDGVSIEIQDLTVTGSTTHAIFTGKIVPNEEFKNFMLSKSSDNRNFKFWIRCEDYTLSGNEINPVWVKCLEGSFNDLFIPLGSYGLEPNIYDHADFRLASPTVFVEDDVRAETAFEIPKNSAWERMTSGIRVINSTTGEQFDLESYTVDMTTIPTLPDGSIPVDLAVVRPFNLSPDNPNTVVEFKRKPSLDDVDNYGVEIVYSALMRWEYWLQQLGTALDFYGNSTKDWVEYFTGDWTVNYFIDLQTPIGVYSDNFAFTLKDYDDWTGTQTVEYFRASDDTPITKPLIGEDTKVRFTFTDTGSLTLGDRWGQITVESFENAPRWDISSVWGWDNVTANPLKPLTGETGCKVTISGADCILECLLDVTKLPNPNKVSLTGRFYVEKEGALTRHKVTVLPVRLPKDPSIQDRGNTGNCCDCIYEVYADLNSEDTYRNHVSSRWVIGENVEFRLYKNGALTSFEPTTQAFPNDTNAKYCTIPWRDVLDSDGRGCYVLKAITESAGIETEITLGTFKLEEFDWSRLVDKICIRSIFNDANLKEGINFTNANVQDCIVLDGDIEEYQPNTEINNLVKADFTQVKTKRENRTKWSVNINFADFCHIKRLTDLHLVGENFLFVSDYRTDAFDKTLLDKAVILSDTMQLTPIYRSERQKGSFQVEEKIVNHVTKYGAVGVSGKVEPSEFPLPNVVNGECLDSTFNINGIEVGTAPSGGILDLNLIDQNSDEVPFVQTGSDLVVTLTSAGTNSAPLMKTGQTTSYRTGDDGDIEAGRAVDFFNLDFVNFFGHSKRFTGITGAYYDEFSMIYRDVNGVSLGNISGSRDVAFPNYLMVDWSTFNSSTGNVLLYYLTPSYIGEANLDFTTCKTFADAINVAGFTGFRVCNFNELYSAFFIWQTNVYPPLVINTGGIGTIGICSDTTEPNDNTLLASIRLDAKFITSYSKTLVNPVITRIFCKYINISEL